MARPEKRQETETIAVTIPVATFNALVQLASHTTFGTVAAYIMDALGVKNLSLDTGD